MGILLGMIAEIRKWDGASKTALGIAFVLLLMAIVALISLPEIRNFTMIGTVGLVIAIQVIFLWGNRTLLSPYSQAQQHFLKGDFEAARDVLKADIDSQATPPIDALVLLGNIYRNLGQLRASESVLRIALARNAHYHFALYGLGKIRLATGDYAEAIQHFQKALQNHAPEIVRFDKALAHYLAGARDDALAELHKLPEPDEAHRALFALYMLHRLEDAPAPDAVLLAEGLPFWEAEVARFEATVYGQAIQNELEYLNR